MSLTIDGCKHSLTEIDGESVCIDCGQVFGYAQVESINDWTNHGVRLYQNTDAYPLISKMAKNLFLPSYSIQTILNVSSKLRKMKITKKQSILFATVYACRIHNIPRLLEDIFYEIERASGRKIRYSEKSLLKLLNKISKKIHDSELCINPPNKDYYLQAYLAKIQKVVIKETDESYFELMRVRSLKHIQELRIDPSTAAKEAILHSTTSIMRSRVRSVLS